MADLIFEKDGAKITIHEVGLKSQAHLLLGLAQNHCEDGRPFHALLATRHASNLLCHVAGVEVSEARVHEALVASGYTSLAKAQEDKALLDEDVQRILNKMLKGMGAL